jgi:acyl-CoA thioesterase-1
MGYAQPVRELLKGKANIHRPSENCGPTEHGLKQLDEWLGDGKWDLIHFNFGLHDLKYLDDKGRYVGPENGKQVAPLPDYEHNLRELVTRLKKTGAKLVWCATTPVPEGSQGRVKGAEVEYNLVAEKIMKENGVAINDLHALAQEHQDQIQLPRNVHFTEDGYKKLAEQVVASIQAQLGK